LSWYDSELQKDDYVIGAAIFAMNGWGIDGSFGMGDAPQIRDYIAQGGSPAPVVIQPPTATQPSAPQPSQPKPPTPPTPPAQPAQPTQPPAQSVTSYTVQSGDTLYGIARKFGVTVAAIVAANNIANTKLIKPGQVLTIPQT
jgi:nucleoid-associated protein YgaU